MLGDENLKTKKHIVISSIEHKCIFAICDYFQKLGYDISLVKQNANGVITAENVKAVIKEGTALVSIMHVYNKNKRDRVFQILANLARGGALIRKHLF